MSGRRPAQTKILRRELGGQSRIVDGGYRLAPAGFSKSLIKVTPKRSYAQLGFSSSSISTVSERLYRRPSHTPRYPELIFSRARIVVLQSSEMRSFVEKTFSHVQKSSYGPRGPREHAIARGARPENPKADGRQTRRRPHRQKCIVFAKKQIQRRTF